MKAFASTLGVSVFCLMLGCSASSTEPSGGSGNTTGYGGNTGTGAVYGNGGGINLGGSNPGTGGSPAACDVGAFDYPGNGLDENCSGVPDDEPLGCDSGVPDVGYADPMIAAGAIGLCRQAQGTSWGVISSKFVMADGAAGMNPASHGLLTGFGPAVSPREGGRMLGLSSGTARGPGDPGFMSPAAADMGTSSGQPPGFPVESPSCPGVVQLPFANDSAALEITIRVPTNAKGLRFDFDFYTYEFPDYICSTYNDFFVAVVNPPPPGAQSGNISFDGQGNPVSVNNGFLEVCPAQNAGGKNFPCSKGTAELQGTGYDELAESGPHAATGWLVTEAPVTPGSEITIRFAIWDAGDHILDSLVLVDNFTWVESEITKPGTQPIK
jgi:hypothetical protein